MLMILYIKNKEKYDLNFDYNKMDPHPFSLACVRYIFVAILLKIEIKNIKRGKCKF